MNRLEAALVEVAGFFESRRTPYMVIGGFANLRWGRPRLTEDLDLKVDVEPAAWEDLVSAVARQFSILVPDPLDFMRDTRVLPIATGTGVRTDLVLAELPYEREAIRRAVTIEVAGKPVRLCTAEDLILHKIISDRPRDREDVEGVFQTRREALDLAFLAPRVEEMAKGLERPDILEFYRSCVKAAGM